jgi:hypothetical protein
MSAASPYPGEAEVVFQGEEGGAEVGEEFFGGGTEMAAGRGQGDEG